MADIRKLTAKRLQVYIKTGATPEELMVQYSCSEEELKNQILRLYSQGNGKKAKEVFSELMSNRKKHRKSKEPEAETKEPEVVIPVVERTLDELKEDLGVISTLEKTVTELEAEEERLSKEVMALEVEYGEYRQEHHVIFGQLRQLRDKLDDIKKEFEKCREEYEKSVADANSVADKMNETCKIRREKLVALEAVRQEIEEKTAVTLYVYDDGRIEAADNLPISFSEDECYQDLKRELSEREECLDLRLRDITTLARLLSLTKYARRIVLVCDNEELEKAFHAICGK